MILATTSILVSQSWVILCQFEQTMSPYVLDMAEYLLKGKNRCLWNWFFMESVVFLLLSSEIILTLGGKIQEPCTQKNYLGFF
jgi:hypothetical protein